MKDIKAAVSDILYVFDDIYPAGFLNQYDQMECLAAGHGKETFLVKQKSGEQLYVAKCYNKDIYTTVHESSILRSLNHSGLPAFIDEFQNDNTLCIVREYVEGEALDQHIQAKTLSQKEIIDICVQLCDILIYLHGCIPPIIHRDIKPRNMIVKPDGTISLIDFDIARVYQADMDTDTEFIGTRKYAPPEQYGFSQTDARTDIYSAGVVLGWLLTGQTDAKEVYCKLGRGALAEIYKKCTSFSPEHRYESAKKLKAALIRSMGNQRAVLLRRILIFLSCVLCLCAGFALGRYSEVFKSKTDKGAAISFDEPMIERAVRLQLGKAENESITQDDLPMVKRLYIFGDSLIAKNEEELQAQVLKLFESNQMREGPIRSLADLSQMPNLEHVFISMQNISDISPLTGLEKLESVEIKNNPVTDLQPLGGLKFLKRVSVYDTRVTDLLPLAGCPMLVELNAGKLPVQSLEAFVGFNGLQSLILYDTTIDTLEGIHKLTRLKHFEVSGVMDNDLSPLLALPLLKEVVLGQELQQAAREIEQKADFAISYR